MVLRRTFFLLLLPIFIGSCGDGGAEIKQREQKEEEMEAMDTEEARELFIRNCESCHGVDGTKQVAGAADLSKTTKSDAEILHTIQYGNEKGMMPYKDVLTKREQQGLVSFVKTLQH